MTMSTSCVSKVESSLPSWLRSQAVNAKSVAIARMIVLIVFSFATPMEWKLESLLL